MSLRTRLLLSLAGSGLAILAGSWVAREFAVRYASEAAIRSSIEARIGAMDQATCEAGTDFDRPEFRGRPRGPRGPNGPGESGRPQWEPGARGPRGDPPDPPEGRPQGPPRRPRPRLDRDPLEGQFGGPFGGRRTEVFFYDAEFKPRPPGGPGFPPAARERMARGERLVVDRDEGEFFGASATGWTGGACTYALAIMPSPPPMVVSAPLIMGALFLIGVPSIVLWFALIQPVSRIRALAAGMRESASARYESSIKISGGDEIAELGHAFNDASSVVRAHLAEVLKREKALRDFVAHTTHDVALPLSVLLSHVSTLRLSVAGREADQAAVAAIAQETQYIASLLANLEAVAKLEAEPLLRERHAVDLTALVERVAVRHRGVAESASVELNHSAPATPLIVTGDVTLLEQAANNLVHNAIQYNHRGGHVALVLERSGEGFVMRVSDDGPGVPKDDVSRLGESRFRSEEARSRRPNGMGLGLSIARDVARHHGFSLELGNRAEGGFEAVLSGSLAPDPIPQES